MKNKQGTSATCLRDVIMTTSGGSHNDDRRWLQRARENGGGMSDSDKCVEVKRTGKVQRERRVESTEKRREIRDEYKV